MYVLPDLHGGNEGCVPELRRRIIAAASAQNHRRGGGCWGKPYLQAQQSNGGTTMTPEERNELIAKYAAGYDEVTGALEGFTAETLTTHPLPGKWSAA